MSKEAKTSRTLSALKKMAREYGCDKNAIVAAALNQYAMQLDLIESIKAQLEGDGEYLVTKEYVKGRENLCINPLIKELPKHNDSANKTAQVLMAAIETYGRPPKEIGKLEELMGQ